MIRCSRRTGSPSSNDRAGLTNSIRASESGFTEGAEENEDDDDDDDDDDDEEGALDGTSELGTQKSSQGFTTARTPRSRSISWALAAPRTVSAASESAATTADRVGLSACAIPRSSPIAATASRYDSSCPRLLLSLFSSSLPPRPLLLLRLPILLPPASPLNVLLTAPRLVPRLRGKANV